ncbi:TetR/AcrR family transcriptional regulator [Streptomyces sp. 891-h]|uniref:TetR/AcrR family transcriptional regulator n=1 Tax=Streptomyces sp. 891-h TaxID=2720714 RepID=UPI001FAA96FE|nr:TetR/AcrR family transcriptional regulator [Streptomyces sp. 891-h]
MTGRLPHLVRSDARDNRARILDAARAVFAEEGLVAPMREVARHAGVGPATLYRHFPTKRALITETFAEQRRTCHTIVRDALADSDPWRGFRHLVEQICELHAHSRGFADAFMTAFPEAMDFYADRERAVRAVAELAHRAQKAGRLRPGFVVDDLLLMLMAHRGVQDVPRAARLAASRRFAAYLIEAFRAVPENAVPESAVPGDAAREGAAPETGASPPLPPAPRLRFAYPRSTADSLPGEPNRGPSGETCP